MDCQKQTVKIRLGPILAFRRCNAFKCQRERERDRSSMSSHISCVTITTLVVVSLANLILLVTVVLESRKKCSSENLHEPYEKFRYSPSKRLSLVRGKSLDIPERKYMAALYLIKYNRILLICGTTIISKQWVLTAAHCCEIVKSYPLDTVKISSNSARWRKGITREVEIILRHSNYSMKTVSHNVCLIKVKAPFRDHFEVPITLAGSRYKYIANTPATTIGWSSKNGDYDNDELYSIQVTLVPFSNCKRVHKLNIDETMVCAKYSSDVDCSYDSGGPLFQNNTVIGIVSFETDCANGVYPRVYTRISYFEQWVKHVEDIKKEKIGAKFKS
ncbi:hypothetical protein NQ317_008495 [Molorchus minor]|uniref:Peptidase S1 domain-containing protein n=1 Tax=Molorchus minor TaxID=1323400 RepID=A0ABQ9JL05_9CUCU|nr:hypothetical protein NQ317_008495 [Molorchus minor]